MAKKNSGGDGGAGLILLVGILLFLPFVIVSLWAFSSLKRQYLARPSIQRVMDIALLTPFLALGGLTMILAVGGAFLAYFKWMDALYLAVPCGIGAAAMLLGGYLIARHLPVLYLGVIADSATGKVYFPYDMQSYGMTNYLSFQFVHDWCSVDSIPLAEIERITRGNRGKDLYLHGKFGSRGITMSSKQKRDECINMILSFSGKKGLLTMEVGGY